MPLVRIDLAGSRGPDQRRAIADAAHRALVEAIGIPEKDRFQVITAHERGSLVVAPEYLGIRHEDPVLLQLTISAGRTLEQKQRLYRRLCELLATAGVPANEVIVNLVEVAKDCWSFGDGVAQYAPTAPTG